MSENYTAEDFAKANLATRGEFGVARRVDSDAWDGGWFTAAAEARGDVWFPAWGRQSNPYREEAGL